jgi:nucleoside-diphosphate-sugar epimerase
VRKERFASYVADALLEAFSSGKVNGVIARSADFYGPGADSNGVPNLVIFERLVSGKSAQWIIDADKVHSLTYTPDCGRALPLLTADESSYNQVWHLPTAHPPITMRHFAEIAAAEIGTQARMSVLPMWMLKLAGLLDKTMRELPEMGYQNDRDYIFDSSRFEQHFGFEPTSYEQGIRETIDYYRQEK